MADDELEDVKCWVEYLWTCPDCSEVNNAGDVEPSGETECAGCGCIVNITGAM